MNSRHIACFVATCALALCALPAIAGQSGNLMKMTVTTRMTMHGMGTMGPMTHTSKVCTSAQRPDPSQMMRHQGDCHVTDYKKSGDSISYHMSCTGQMQMTGSGTYHMLGGGDIQGSMHIEGKEGPQSIVMDTQYTGKRIGSCDYTPPAKSD